MARILITGASGFLGAHTARTLAMEGHRVSGTYGSHKNRYLRIFRDIDIQGFHVDLTREDAMTSIFKTADPEIVIHSAALADPDSCQKDPALARQVNVEATDRIARLCLDRNARMIFFSTDQVFDGKKGGYSETDPPNPIHVYGQTKAEAEGKVTQRLGQNATVLRITLVYGNSPSGRRSSSEQVLNLLAKGEKPRLFHDEIRTPILAEDVAKAVSELVAHEAPPPLLNLGGPDAVSRYELGLAVARAYGLDSGRLEAIPLKAIDPVAPRPPDLSLDTTLARKSLKRPPRTLQDGISWLASQDPRPP